MFKNKLPITAIFGIGLISIGLFFLFTVAAILYNQYMSRSFFQYFLVLGSFFCLTGLGMILQRKWIRTLLAISIFLLGVFMVLYGIGTHLTHDIIQQIGTSILSIGICLFLLLLLYNQKVSEEFGIKEQDKATEDILDIIE